jgi:methionyl aminopeptidase
MIRIKNEAQLDKMRIAARVTGAILHDLSDFVRPGISTADIDDFVESRIIDAGMLPNFKGLYGFPAAACISVNEEIVHGIPNETRKLVEGDIVSVDIGTTYDGWQSDAARTYPVGNIPENASRLIEATKASFFAGLEFCKVGRHLSDISHAIQTSAEAAGYSVVRDFVGHGIGKDVHEDPQIANFGEPGKGNKLIKGMVFAIEPMINEGTFELEVLDNEWTAVTLDRKLSAHYENTVVITDGEPEILTLDERDK